MAVKYLSEEWTREVTSLLQESEAVAQAGRGLSFSVQQVVTDVADAPDGGEVKYYFKVTDGVPEVHLGLAEGPDATVIQSYETAVALDKGELNPPAAFMQGKLKIQGDLMKMMQLQGYFQTLPGAVATLAREY
jgi:putative sterol carrier protein